MTLDSKRIDEVEDLKRFLRATKGTFLTRTILGSEKLSNLH